MPLFEVAFKVRHDCPFGNLSRKFPSMRMFVWCNREHEVIEIALSERSQYEEMRRAINSLVGVMDIASDGGNIRIITKKCFCTTKNSVGRNLDAHNMLHLMPVIYEGGWEYYHAIAFRHSDFRQFVDAVERLPCELVVVRKSTLNGNLGGSVTVPVSDLFANLTSKQIEALLTSYFRGYFTFPRKANVMNIAKAKRVPRTTFQEHLTKAENKLIAGLVPYLTLFQAKSVQSSGPRQHWRAASSFPRSSGLARGIHRGERNLGTLDSCYI